jgi:hypothetical protein
MSEPRVLRWLRDRPLFPVVDATQAGAPAVPPNGYERQLSEREIREERRREDEAEEEAAERSARRRLRQLEARVAEARALKALDRLEGGGDDHQSNAIAQMLGQVLEGIREDRRILTETIKGFTESQQTAQVRTIQAGMERLDGRLAELLNGRSTAAQVSPIQALTANATEMKQAKDALLDVFGLTPAAGEGAAAGAAADVRTMSREDAMRWLSIEEEVADRRAERIERREQREWEKEQVREEFKLKRDRLDRAFGKLDQIAVPALALLLGDRVKGLLGPRGEGASAEVGEDGEPMGRWQCDTCGLIQPHRLQDTEVTCTQCGQPSTLHPRAAPPQAPLQVVDGGQAPAPPPVTPPEPVDGGDEGWTGQ